MNELPRNDDQSSDAVPLGFTANFFGTEYDELFVNNNGNVTFDESQFAYTPSPIGELDRVIIAPFWADVDTRSERSLPTSYGTGEIDGRRAFAVDWVNVGYYDFHDDKLNTFQLVLIDRSDLSPGDFDIEMNYDTVAWETGDASDGVNGFGGVSARVGYSNGTGTKAFELPGSGEPGSFLDSSRSGLINASRGSSQLGRYLFEVRNGRPIPELKVMSWNTRHADPRPLAAVAYHQVGTSDDLVGVAALQEACLNKVRLALSQLRKRTGAEWDAGTFGVALDGTEKCRFGQSKKGAFGNAIISNQPIVDSGYETFVHQTCDRSCAGKEQRNYAWALLDTPVGAVKVYSVHLVNGLRSRAVRRDQVAELVSDLQDDPFDGPRLILGDFNPACKDEGCYRAPSCPDCASFDRDLLEPLYDAYIEADDPATGVTPPYDAFTCCLGGRTDRKFDFIFVSGATVVSAVTKTVSVESSDHKPLVAGVDI